MNKERELIELIESKTPFLESACDFLLGEFVISKNERLTFDSLNKREKIEVFYSWLKREELQLVSYEWQILPEEKYKLTIVAKHNSYMRGK